MTGATAQPADELEVRLVRAGDAPALVRCVERCYGATYPSAAFYDAQLLRGMIERGEHQGVVALAGEALVGHIAVRPPAGGTEVVEAGTTIVDPEHRGIGVMGKLAIGLVGLCQERGLAGFVHFPTTAHALMQRVSLTGGGRETGIFLGYIPAQTADRALERASAGRLAVTVVYQPISAARPQELFAPARYERAITAMAGDLRITRRWIAAGEPAAGATQMIRSTDPIRSLERVTLERIGADVADVAAGLARSEQDLVHVDLPMSDGAIDAATEALVAAGFVFAAWLPGWGGHDVLRLQRVRPAQASDQVNVFSEDAAAILRLIGADAAAARSG